MLELIKSKQLDILTKCPENNKSNYFWANIAMFKLIRIDPGKKRKLNIYFLKNNTNTLEKFI
jgi:hypothetical protein